MYNVNNMKREQNLGVRVRQQVSGLHRYRHLGSCNSGGRHNNHHKKNYEHHNDLFELQRMNQLH